MRYFIMAVFLLVCCSDSWAQGPPPANVIVAKVSEEELADNQSVIGVLYYEKVSEVSSEVAGLVESVEVQQGDRVKKGDPLVLLDTEILETEIALTRARLRQIDLRIDNSRKNFKRLEKIYNEAAVSEKSYDDALYNLEDAKMERVATEQSLQKLLIQKNRSQILAPFDGIVLSKNVETGAWVQQGSQLIKVGSSKDLYVRAPIAEDMLKFISMGDTVEVEINAFGKKLGGKIINIDPVADVKTKNVFLKINLPKLELVAENMSATVYVDASEKRILKVLPRAAVVKFQGKDFVYTIKEGKAAIMPVNIVSYLGERVAVDDPYITAGMQVVVEGNERLRPDQPVNVTGER